MRTIATINQKGGCGKTTVSINLAAVLAARGSRTVLVDMDPQSHCALGLAVPETQIERSVYDMIRAQDGSVAWDDIVWQISRNLDLIPSTMALAGLEQELANSNDKDRRLMQVLGPIGEQYDFCIIDCPPSIGLLTFNALRAAGEVIIPVETGYFALQGSIKQEATVQMLAQRVGHQVRFNVLATMYDVRTKLAREILTQLRRQFGQKMLPVVVHFNSKLKESASFGQPITEYAPACRGVQDFNKLAAWLLANPPQSPDRTPATDKGDGAMVNRAAELVERARALAARTEPLARLGTRPDPPRNQVSAPTTATAGSARISGNGASRFGVHATPNGLLFVQPANGRTNSIHIAADFNDWSPKATPLEPDRSGGIFRNCVQVAPGRYRYRLVVDGQWSQDPYNSDVEANPYGDLNNIVEIGLD